MGFFGNVLYLWVHLAGSQLPGRVRGGPPSLVSQLIVGDRPIIQQVMAEQTSANVFLLRKWDFGTDMTKWLTARLERRQMEDRRRAGCKQMIWEGRRWVQQHKRCDENSFPCRLLSVPQCDGNMQRFLSQKLKWIQTKSKTQMNPWTHP